MPNLYDSPLLNRAMKERLKPLIGARITCILKDIETLGDDYPPIYGLRLLNGNLTINLWFMADEEGNGPGDPLVEIFGIGQKVD